MDRVERIVLLHRQFVSYRFGSSTETLMALSKSSRATLTRDLSVPRDGLGAPLVNDGKRPCTWRYENPERAGFQLPGLWLGPDDLYALLLLEQLAGHSGASLLGDSLTRLRQQLGRWLGEQVRHLNRLRVLRTRARRCDPQVFRTVADALLKRRQLRFTYTARSSAATRERTVSPQRLTHQADNWYLDAWDPLHTDLRRFAVDRICAPLLLRDPALELTDAQINARLDAVFGAFAGSVGGIATIRFSAHAARWVVDELWHPDQRMQRLPDGGLDLEVPYSNPRELLMEIQRYGAEAEVLGPAPLRRQIREQLRQAAGVYAQDHD